MPTILVNALSVLNQSGRHVLLGHLSRLAKATRGTHTYVVYYHYRSEDMVRDLGDNVAWKKCPDFTHHWLFRTLWESFTLPKLVQKEKFDFSFTPSGTHNARLGLPQIVFAQNPWCLVRGLERSKIEHVKAWLQRAAYRQAMKKSLVMVFNSEYMHRAYTDNAGSECQRHAIAYQGIAEETHAAAVKSRGRIARKPLQIASVSAMAPHKGVETVVQALAKLRRTRNLSPSLLLIGIWPVPAYEQRIRRLVIATGLQNVVTFLGHVSQEDLYRYYAESSVFCLMSQCESFGIPAVEAQAFGTPVVSSNCCAIPEVCGSGGIFPAPGDVAGTAGALAELLTRRDTWNRLSTAAVQNAAKYHWDICSQPLISTLQTLRRESI